MRKRREIRYQPEELVKFYRLLLRSPSLSSTQQKWQGPQSDFLILWERRPQRLIKDLNQSCKAHLEKKIRFSIFFRYSKLHVHTCQKINCWMLFRMMIFPSLMRFNQQIKKIMQPLDKPKRKSHICSFLSSQNISFSHCCAYLTFPIHLLLLLLCLYWQRLPILSLYMHNQ